MKNGSLKKKILRTWILRLVFGQYETSNTQHKSVQKFMQNKEEYTGTSFVELPLLEEAINFNRFGSTNSAIFEEKVISKDTDYHLGIKRAAQLNSDQDTANNNRMVEENNISRGGNDP